MLKCCDEGRYFGYKTYFNKTKIKPTLLLVDLQSVFYFDKMGEILLKENFLYLKLKFYHCVILAIFIILANDIVTVELPNGYVDK